MPILLQISIEVNSGSVGRIAEQIGEVAISNGWESYITYARNHQVSSSKTIKIGTRWDVYWHGLQTRILDNHGFASKNATIKLIDQIKVIQPDIIQLHHIHGYFLNMQLLFEFLSVANIPVVWIFHDCWAFTGHCAYFDSVNCDKWKNQCFSCPQKRNYPASIFIDRSKRNYLQKKILFTSVNNMTIVSVSNWLANLVKESFFKKYPICVIPNAVDINIFTPKTNILDTRLKYGIGSKNILLGVASCWDERKRLIDYVKLADVLPENTLIVLVGLNKKQIKSLPLGIIGIERTENVYELSLLYSMADIVLNLSVEETFGLTTVEGMACGTPGIVYNSTASPELITDETGIIVKKNDIKGVLAAVETILSRGKSYYTIACRERAVKFFNKDNRFQDYMKLYEKLLNSKDDGRV